MQREEIDRHLARIMESPDVEIRRRQLDDFMVRHVAKPIEDTAKRLARPRKQGPETRSEILYDETIALANVKVYNRLLKMILGDAEAISSVHAYVRHTTEDAFQEALRTLDPEFRLNYSRVWTAHKRGVLAKWWHSDVFCGGIRDWKPGPAVFNLLVKQIMERPEAAFHACFPSNKPTEVTLTTLLKSMYLRVDGPMRFAVVVSFVADLRGGKQTVLGPDDADAHMDQIPDRAVAVDVSSLHRHYFEALHALLNEMKPFQRAIYILPDRPDVNEYYLPYQFDRLGLVPSSSLAKFVDLSDDRIRELYKPGRQITKEEVGSMYGIAKDKAEGIHRAMCQLVMRRLTAEGLPTPKAEEPNSENGDFKLDSRQAEESAEPESCSGGSRE